MRTLLRLAGIGALFALELLISQGAETESSPESIVSSGPARHSVEAASEALWTSGIIVTDESAGYQFRGSQWDLSLSVSYSTLDLTYQPADFDIISRPMELNQRRVALQGGLKRKLAPSLTLLGSGGVYDGYTSYRTLWVTEYYRQYYFEVPGYQKTEPRGLNLSAGVRWEYRPASGFLQVDGIYSRDDIPSGYEIVVLPPPRIGTALLSSPNRLHTVGARLSLENVLSRRLRALNEFQIADTTARNPRLSYQGSLNWALGERWVFRPVVGASLEEPNFNSVSFAASLEYDWEQRWFLGLIGRFYRDSGEIANPQLFNVAAPALETFQVGVGLRWQGDRWSAKLTAGPYFTRYDAVEADIKPFEKLYRSRDWGLAQVTLSCAF
ncbi:MAG: hypothetical protein HY735_21600 [Verrucomicrobia bacterium]|nr:hypothetical protein [Verrucomicrobiota bacterium]